MSRRLRWLLPPAAFFGVLAAVHLKAVSAQPGPFGAPPPGTTFLQVLFTFASVGFAAFLLLLGAAILWERHH